MQQESLVERIAEIVGSWELLVGGNGFGLGGNSRNCVGHGQKGGRGKEKGVFPLALSQSPLFQHFISLSGFFLPVCRANLKHVLTSVSLFTW